MGRRQRKNHMRASLLPVAPVYLWALDTMVPVGSSKFVRQRAVDSLKR